MLAKQKFEIMKMINLKFISKSIRLGLLLSAGSLALAGCSNNEDLLIDNASPELLNNYFLYSNKMKVVDASSALVGKVSGVEIKPDSEDIRWGKLWLYTSGQQTELPFSQAQIVDCDHPEDTSITLRCDIGAKSEESWFEIRQLNADETVLLESEAEHSSKSLELLRDQIFIQIHKDAKTYQLVAEFEQHLN